MKEYLGFKYQNKGGNKWKITYPNGFAFTMLGSEGQVRERIDAIVASTEQP